MQVFFPVIGCHFRLNNAVKFKLLTNKTNAKYLNYLNLLPGCLPVSTWERNQNIQSVEVSLEKDTMLTIDKIEGKQHEAEVHFSVYIEGTSNGKKHKFAILLKDINYINFDVRY